MRVAIIGSGAVAEAMARALVESEGVDLVQIYGRNEARITEIYALSKVGYLSYVSQLTEADVYVICVSDSAISTVTRELNFPAGAVVVHTSGATPMSAIESSCDIRRGVLYPLQSFTRGRRIDMRETPIFIEAEDRETMQRVEQLAKSLSDHTLHLNSEKRRELHLSAVFASNFTNAMLSATYELLGRSNLPLSLYAPLVRETIDKAFAPATTPMAAQTGPAKRGDTETMKSHVEAIERLTKSAELIEIYNIISKYIWETSKKI